MTEQKQYVLIFMYISVPVVVIICGQLA